MKNINEVLTANAGKSPEEMAEAIAKFYAAKNRKKTIDDDRRNVRNKMFADCNVKLSKTQQEALLFLYMSEHVAEFRAWLRKEKPEICGQTTVMQASYKRATE